MPDGTLKGRAAPEIDIFEAQVTGNRKLSVSQSCQFAPFNYKYEASNTTGPAWTLFQLVVSTIRIPVKSLTKCKYGN